jgi:hypothetical protein
VNSHAAKVFVMRIILIDIATLSTDDERSIAKTPEAMEMQPGVLTGI